MNQPLPRISLAGLPALPPSGSLQFFDGYFPALPAGSYNVNVAQTLSGGSSPPSFSLPQQSFAVQAPEFFIDTTIVQTIYPPAGGSDQYGQRLPFLVLDDPSLPWERSLVPDSAPAGPANPTPWMALLIFAEGEILLPPNSNNPVSTRTVSELLTADPDKKVLKPTLPANWVSDALLASTCQTITIPGGVFNAVMPSTADLSYLAHCRGVNTPSEGEQLLSVLLCNRLAVANGTVHPAAPLRYYAHLVSLEGYGGYLAPNGSPIPPKPSGGLMDVQLVSLFSWTFVSLPETGQSFEALVEGLIQSEQATAGSLESTAVGRHEFAAEHPGPPRRWLRAVDLRRRLGRSELRLVSRPVQRHRAPAAARCRRSCGSCGAGQERRRADDLSRGAGPLRSQLRGGVEISDVSWRSPMRHSRKISTSAARPRGDP